MNYPRLAVVCLVLGFFLVPFGLYITGAGQELAKCHTYSGGGFERIGISYLIWNDGCNDHFIPTISVSGGLSIVAGTGIGGAAVLQRF